MSKHIVIEQSSSSTPLQSLESWKLREVAAITGGELNPRWAERPFGPLSTDSRAVGPGQFFLALAGEKFDGHRFCEMAAARGAAGLIVNLTYESPETLKDLPVVRVEDTLKAYGDLAAARRRAWGGPVLAVSGSAGKTTTRRMLAESLGRHRRVLEPIKNYNNLIGVPHTLLGLAAEHEVAVMELGMNLPGELRRLTEIAEPTAAMLTQIGLTHAGMFATVEDLVRAKLDLFEGCRPGTPLVVNAACPRTMGAVARFANHHPIVRFLGEGQAIGDAKPDVTIENVTPLAPIGYRFDLRTPGGTLTGLELRLFGRHHLANVAATAALLHAAGFPPGWVAGALDGFHSEPLRGDIVKTESGMTFLLDCYNASPPSMMGALESLAELPPPEGGRRVLVLADMLELGVHSAEAHRALLGPLRRLAPALFFGLGPESTALAQTLAGEGWPAWGFDAREALIAALRARLAAGDMVFFKGSHGFGLEKAAQALAPESVSLG